MTGKSVNRTVSGEWKPWLQYYSNISTIQDGCLMRYIVRMIVFVFLYVKQHITLCPNYCIFQFLCMYAVMTRLCVFYGTINCSLLMHNSHLHVYCVVSNNKLLSHVLIPATKILQVSGMLVKLLPFTGNVQSLTPLLHWIQRQRTSPV